MISKTYQPQDIEAKWYAHWLENKYFASKPNPNKEPYTVVIPPPNVTGVLHMGHMLNNTIQDVLVRKARMEGKEACWVPGTDHASIATEAKVVAMLKEQGINKKDLSREDFLKHAWQWKEKYGGIILEQLKKLGASCDWDRTRFTMDEKYSEQVIDVFVDLYNKGLVYRGIRMVNWDPQSKTALSDEEVIYKDVQSKLYHIEYQIVPPAPNSPLAPKGGINTNALTEINSEVILSEEKAPPSGAGGARGLVIATSRPETIMADAAICVHPNDERYKHLHGQKVFIPLINKEIPIITDEYVTMDFGTGCLKVTPAHDLNDYELGIKHNLPVIDILNDDGTLNEKAQILVGQDRFAARKAIVKLLDEAGHLVKIEEYKANIGTSERTGAVIEPKLSLQWFLKMKDLSKPALENVMNDNIKLYPPKFKNTYRVWMENVRDWCISRQLWWGHQIPAFYLKDGTVIVAKNKHEALHKAQHDLQLFALTEEDLEQDPDVLDTWASSWLWPISVFDGLEDAHNEDINYYYPTNDLVTAPEILFFWVARMIIAGYEYRGEAPFKNVYLTGIVRDKQGRKMSKSLGNSPDPLDLIAQYGADGVRTGMLFSSPAGNDLPYDDKLVEQGRNFCNKIWNAYRLINSLKPENSNTTQNQGAKLGIDWFESKLNQTLAEVQDHFGKFRISDALLAVYNLIWDDFCAKYLEIIKPPYGELLDEHTHKATVSFFERLMCLAHPFMPFITEEIWQNIGLRQSTDSICIAGFPTAGSVDNETLADFEILFELVSKVREIRNSKGLSPKIALPLFIRTNRIHLYQSLEGMIMKLANTSAIEFVNEKVEKATGFVIKGDECFVMLAGETDTEADRATMQKDLVYNLGFRQSVEAKLANQKFMANAKPELIEREHQKLADANAKIKALQEALG